MAGKKKAVAEDAAEVPAEGSAETQSPLEAAAVLARTQGVDQTVETDEGTFTVGQDGSVTKTA